LVRRCRYAMSVLGTKRPLRQVRFMSAVGGRSRLDMLSQRFSESDPKLTSGISASCVRNLWRGRGALHGLFCPDTREVDYLAPFFSIVCDQLAEVRGRACEHSSSKLNESCVDFRIGDSRINLLIEFVDDIGRCAPGCADTEPSARL